MPVDATSYQLEPHWQTTIPIWSRAIGSWNFSISRNPFQTKELEHHYDQTADVWQSKIEKLGFVGAYQRLIASALQQTDTSAHDESCRPLQVLDAGIGTGAMSVALSKEISGDIDLLGVDLSQQMLNRARQELRAPNIKLETIKSDLSTLPIGDNTIDIVLMAHVIEHLADPTPVLRELHRVLKPGGLLIACITRRSTFGRYIQLVWRTHQVETNAALNWMEAGGFEAPSVLPLDKQSGTRKRSIGYLAHKPQPTLL